jgi:hypothetical protein
MTDPAAPPQIVVPGVGWVDVASRAIVQVGFPVVVAAVLLWFILGRFTNDVNAIAARMEGNAKAIELFTAMQNDQLAEMKEHTKELREQTQLMKEFVMQKKYGGQSRE